MDLEAPAQRFDGLLFLNDVKSSWSLGPPLIRYRDSSSLEQDRFQPLRFGGRDFAGFFHRMDFRQIEWVWSGSVSVALVPATDARRQNLRDNRRKQSDDEDDAAGDGRLL